MHFVKCHRKLEFAAFTFTFICHYAASRHSRPLRPTPVLPLTAVRTCKDENVQRWEERMEKKNWDRGLLLIAQLSQHRCTRLHAISSTTSPSKLQRNPGNLTMSWDRVPKHGAEGGRGGEKWAAWNPVIYFFSLSPVKALLLVSYLLNPLIVI